MRAIGAAKRDELRAQRGDAIPGWTLHDLRRTATTGMARLKIARHVVDRILNHTGGTIHGVAAVYNRFEYLDERRATLEAWGRFVDELISPSLANVLAFRG
jgi:integrase